MEMPETTLSLLRWIGFAQRKAAQDWIDARGLSFEQGFVLGWLQDNPGAIQREIQRMTRTSAASVSSLLQGLERRGLVERRSSPDDDRSKRVFSTAEGARLVEGFDHAMEIADETILAPLDADERRSLDTLLRKITAQLAVPERI